MVTAREMQERCAQACEGLEPTCTAYVQDSTMRVHTVRYSPSRDYAAAIRALPCDESPAVGEERTMTPEQIKHMVDRFLAWKLPANFRPDAGISFKAAYNEHTTHPMKHEPSGTNLFDATQAEVMVRHMIEGLPCPAVAPAPEPPADLELETTAEERAQCATFVADDFTTDGMISLVGERVGALLRDHDRLSAEVARLNEQSAELYKLQFEANERVDAVAPAPAAADASEMEEPKP